MHAIETLKNYLGWCPCEPMLKGQNAPGAGVARRGGTPDADGPQPESPRGMTTGSPDWLEAAAIVILFATLFVGGYWWWPALVLAVLAAGLAHVHLRGRRGAC